MNKPLTGITRRKLRSSEWFNNPHNPGNDRALSGALPELRADPA